MSFAAADYEALVLSCIDPRFQRLVFEHENKELRTDKYSAFTVAGASIGVVAPAFKAWHETFWENLAASVQLHNIKLVVVMNHRDCGAAKLAFGASGVAEKEVETGSHAEALIAFRKEVNARHPKLSVITGIMDVSGRVDLVG